ncbi:polysaccharide biosynthesis tyrosine autokinase [uncultured Ruminococcus sp.]|uniref:polysaccharide biosynthesis tyrosine autokinase n=1 Tax=uncultured Ruminococcus sp. TaxID=165186 RepID=UPI0025EB488C|nr:polysaccharide biosynthesis tyrosine autokinase [uncultured Ruminococcus sp.]
MHTSNAVNLEGYTEPQRDHEEDDEVSISLSNLMIAFRMFYWIIILAILIGILGGIAASKFLYEPVYSTSATFTIAESRSSDVDYGFKSTLDDKLVSAETYVITSSTLKEMLVNNLGENYSVCQISADEITETNIVTIHVTADSKAKAYVAVEEVIADFPKISQKIFGDVSVSLLDEVEASDTPVNSGQKNKMIALGGAAGLLIGAAVVFLYSLSLNLVSDAETLQKYVNVECVGKAPMLTSKVVGQVKYITVENRNVPNDFKEAFQFIRTRTERVCRRNDYKSILVTSTFPGEGKTTTSMNIAMSMAQNNKTVIIIDCDLRNPSLIERLGAKNGAMGLDDYLNGECSFDDALVQLPKSKVFFATCKNPMSNAAEAIVSEEMARAVKEAKEKADYVIIDTPPSDLMGDAIALTRYADAVLFVVKQNYGKLNNVIYAVESMKQTKAELIGFVLNGSYDKMNLLEYTSYGKYNKYAYSNRYYNKKITKPSENNEA